MKFYVNGAEQIRPISLGKAGEVAARVLRVDLPTDADAGVDLDNLIIKIVFLNPAQQGFPTAALTIKTESGGQRYIEYTVEGGVITEGGHGALQVIALTGNGSLIWKSATYATYTSPSIDGTGTMPDAVPGWIAELEAAKQAAFDAEAAAEAAALAAQEAAAAALAAEAAALAAISGGVESAQAAQAAAEAARDLAISAKNAAESAQGLAETAKGAAQTAQGLAEGAAATALDAQSHVSQDALTAQQARDAADDFALESYLNYQAAAAAQSAAEAAQSAAVSAKNFAESARDAAQGYASSAQSYATAAQGYATSASGSKDLAESAKTAAQAAQTAAELAQANTLALYNSFAASFGGGGQGINLYYSPTGSGVVNAQEGGNYDDLMTSPTDTVNETAESVAVVLADGDKYIDGYISAALNKTQIPAGFWQFSFWAKTSSTSSNTQTIKAKVYSRASNGTLTHLFDTPASANLTTAAALYELEAIRPAFTVNATDRLVVKVYCTNSNATSRTVTFYHNGPTHYSHIHTPMLFSHNDLPGLNQGDFLHLSAAEKAAMAVKDILSDTVYNASWESYSLAGSNSSGSLLITTGSAHGLAVGDPVEFDANGGTLPTGILNYDNGARGGMYYNVATVPSGTSFTVAATVGSTTPIAYTNDGSGAWRLRRAGMDSITISGLDFDTYKKYRIWLIGGFAKKTTAAIAASVKFNSNSTNFQIFNGGQSTWAQASLGIVVGNLINCKKISYLNSQILLQRLDASTGVSAANYNGISSDDKSAMTAHANVAAISHWYNPSPESITSLTLGLPLGLAAGNFRNGFRVIVERVGG